MSSNHFHHCNFSKSHSSPHLISLSLSSHLITFSTHVHHNSPSPKPMISVHHIQPFSPIMFSHQVSYYSIHKLAIAPHVPVLPLAPIQGESTDLFAWGRMRVTGCVFVCREESFTGLCVTKIPVLCQQAERVAPPASSVSLAQCKTPEM